MNGYGGWRKHYQFEVNELDLQFALQAVEMEGGPGGNVDDIWDSVTDTAGDIWDSATHFISDTFNVLSDPMSIFEDPFGAVSDLYDIAEDFVEETVEDIEDAVEDAWETVENAWDSICESCSDAWEAVCEVWDDWGKQIIGIVAIVVCSWIPCVNVVVAAAVIGALQAGLESGWDLQAMAVGAAAGAISQGCGGSLVTRAAVGALKSGYQSGWDLEAMAVGGATGAISGVKGGVAGKAALGALKAGHASDWDVSEMGEGALTGAATSYIDGKLELGDKGIMGSKFAGEVVEGVIENTVESCARNGLNTDAVVLGIASGVGDSFGTAAAFNIETDSNQARGLIRTVVSSATSSAIVATAKGDDVESAVVDSLKQDTVRYAVRELVELAYNELPDNEAGQLIERQCSMVTNAVADAAASVTVGGDFGDTFKNEFNYNLKKEADTIKEELKDLNTPRYETGGPMPVPDPTGGVGIYREPIYETGGPMPVPDPTGGVGIYRGLNGFTGVDQAAVLSAPQLKSSHGEYSTSEYGPAIDVTRCHWEDLEKVPFELQPDPTGSVGIYRGLNGFTGVDQAAVLSAPQLKSSHGEYSTSEYGPAIDVTRCHWEDLEKVPFRLQGDVGIFVEYDNVPIGCAGTVASCGVFVDTDNLMDSGVFKSTGVAYGGSEGLAWGPFVTKEVEGTQWEIDVNYGPYSTTLYFNQEGVFQGAGFTKGFGYGVAGGETTAKAYTLNDLVKDLKRIMEDGNKINGGSIFPDDNIAP